MRSLALVLALSVPLGASGCAHTQLTNRQVATGAVAAGVIVLLLVMLSTQCDNDNGNDCTFQ